MKKLYVFTRGSGLTGERRSQNGQLKGEAHSRSYGRRLQAEQIGASASRERATPVNMYKTLLALTLFSLTACIYRMPTDDDISTVPTTNHPDVVREQSSGMMPGGSY